MSQEARRRVAAWQRLVPAPRREADIPERLRIRRFSQGLELAVLDRLKVPSIGRFSSGVDHQAEPADASHIGRFSRGQDDGRDEDSAHLRVGTYADGSRPPTS
jgi:hypothetical protein